MEVLNRMVGMALLGVVFFAVEPAAAAFVGATAMNDDVKDKDDNPADMSAGSFSGNDAQGGGSVGVNQLNISFPSFTWTFITDNLSFVESSQGVGTITLGQDVTSDALAITLKASTFWSGYKFLNSYSSGDTFSYTTAGVAVNPNNSKSPGLSHAGLYVGTRGGGSAPELGSIAIWAVVIGLTLGCRRRRHS